MKSTGRPIISVKVDGEAVQKLRLRLGMTQAEAAHRCGIHRVVWGNIEQDRSPRRSIVTARRVAKVLGVPVTDISPDAGQWETKWNR